MSDDGRFLTFEERLDSGQNAVMVIDLDNGTKTRVSGSPRRDNPLFLDNDTLIFDSRMSAERKLYRQPIRGGASEEIVTEGAMVSEPFLHPDSDRVVFRHVGDDLKDEVRTVSLSTGEEEILIAPNKLVFDPSVSPDGRFVAYETVRTEDGRTINEVHVSGIDVEGSWVVGTGPTTINDHVWSHDGRYLYFSDADVLYRVRILEGSGFSYSRKKVVATVPPGAQMALDTRRNRAIVVALEAAVNPRHVPIRVLQNYASSLESLIPDSE
ncbi:MAG: hypothetical protein OXT73_08865 [Bacteroidota bacterium]|nr:hypothetical protein [Bacteroidota bacterium]